MTAASAAGRRPRRQPTLPLGGGLRLRPWGAADAAGLVLAHRDPLVRRYATSIVTDRVQAQGVIASWSQLWSQGAGAAWAIGGPSAGDVLGALVFVVRDAVSGRAEVGYWLVPPGRGRGLATAALRLGSETVLACFGWHRLEASHAVGNERSCAVASRAGFRAEAVLRQAQYYPDAGEWVDEHLHARIAGDSAP